MIGRLGMLKLKLTSAMWGALTHAYGSASDVPDLISKLRAASLDDWDEARDALLTAIFHHGDVYTASFAAVAHWVGYAMEIGPCKQSDELLSAVGYAAGRNGPEIPARLEETWEQAQEEASAVILERLIAGTVTESNAGDLIAGLLDLNG